MEGATEITECTSEAEHFTELLKEEVQMVNASISDLEDKVQTACRALRKLECVREALLNQIGSNEEQLQLDLDKN
tara:strand:- start:41 stop:265 length:225 start_codon:yes stop_codon:yes gene_type:complete